MSLQHTEQGIAEIEINGKRFVVCAEPVVWVGEEHEPVRRDPLGDPIRYCGQLIEVTGRGYRATETCGNPANHVLGTHYADAIGAPGY